MMVEEVDEEGGGGGTLSMVNQEEESRERLKMRFLLKQSSDGPIDRSNTSFVRSEQEEFRHPGQKWEPEWMIIGVIVN